MRTMNSEASFTPMLPPVAFNRTNYQTWLVKMEAYFDGSNQWEAVEDECKVLPLLDNPTVGQIKLHKIEDKGKLKLELVYSQQSHPQF